MNHLPHPLVQPGATSKQVGQSLARLIATIRKKENTNIMKTPEPNLLKALSQIQALPDIPESKNPETHTCHTCGHTWKHGAHGGHSCVDRLVPQLAAMQAERDAAQAQVLVLREALADQQYGGDDECRGCGRTQCCSIDCEINKALSSPPPPVVTVASAKASIRRYFQACVDAGEL